jgi:hypothetical protein
MTLDDIRVASPCAADWNRMAGDDRARFCASCRKNVYNLSAMTREEAERLILEKEGRLCVRYFRRADGTILTRDCPVGLARLRRRLWAAWGVAAALVSAAGAFLWKGEAEPHRPAVEGVLGDVALPVRQGGGLLQGKVACPRPVMGSPPLPQIPKKKEE